MTDNDKTYEDLAIENRALRVYIAILEGSLDELSNIVEAMADQGPGSDD